jgi:hypothetical protein
MDFIGLPAQTISPSRRAGASCLVTSASFGAAGLQAKARSGYSADLRTVN